ncbi:MFS transporter [Angustibacter sp. McL0619]|uniref:MFS transporter n=1 Tax=Angustibacter sp. McL0619 TaxID=3415676 RepID=UPI003CF1BE49
MTAQTLNSSAAPGRMPSAPRSRINASPAFVLGTVLVAQLMVVLDASIVNVALPDMARSLGLGQTGLSWVMNAYTLAFGGFLLLGARAGDLLGRRRVFLAGMTVFVAASFAGGLATTGELLIAARAVQGLGAALAAPAVLAMLTISTPEGRERTRALGLFTAVSIGGAAIGLVAGGMLTQWVSWRWVMFVNVPIGLAVIVMAALVLPETPRHSGRVDVAGAITSTIGMTALVYGFVHAADAGWSDPVTLASFATALVLLAAFVLVERVAAAPVTPLSLFADRTRSAAYLGRMLLVAGMMGMFFFMTQLLQTEIGYGPLKAGLAFLPVTVGVLIASQLSARRLVEALGPRPTMVLGALVSAASVFWLSHTSSDPAYWTIGVPLFLMGLGNGTVFVPITGAALQGVDPKHAGAAAGLVNVAQQIGSTLGLAVLVTVFSAAGRHAAAAGPGTRDAVQQAQHVFVSGADAALLTAAGLILATAVVATTMYRTPRRSRSAATAPVVPALD